MSDFDAVWRRILAMHGQEFRQKTGNTFRYSVVGNGVTPNTTARMLSRSQFERAYERLPLAGPGQLQDLQGPSYLYAILVDRRVAGGLDNAPLTVPPAVVPQAMPSRRVNKSEVSSVLPIGWLSSSDSLHALGFEPLGLRLDGPVELLAGIGTNWTTVGDVPDAPGLYSFTLTRTEECRVVYVGMTTHLWMVTRGVLPGSVARPGQRYGRPRYAGATRQRVNALATRAFHAGWILDQWVKPYALPHIDQRAALRSDEESLIVKWDLRACGWNRG